MNIDKDLAESLVKTLGTLAGIATAGYQAYNLGIRGFQAKAALKKDIELLKTLSPGSDEYKIIETHISNVIKRLYAPPRPPVWTHLGRLKPKNVGMFLGYLALFAFFAVWTAYLNRSGFSW